MTTLILNSFYVLIIVEEFYRAVYCIFHNNPVDQNSQNYSKDILSSYHPFTAISAGFPEPWRRPAFDPEHYLSVLGNFFQIISPPCDRLRMVALERIPSWEFLTTSEGSGVLRISDWRAKVNMDHLINLLKRRPGTPIMEWANSLNFWKGLTYSSNWKRADHIDRAFSSCY